VAAIVHTSKSRTRSGGRLAHPLHSADRIDERSQMVEQAQAFGPVAVVAGQDDRLPKKRPEMSNRAGVSSNAWSWR